MSTDPNASNPNAPKPSEPFQPDASGDFRSLPNGSSNSPLSGNGLSPAAGAGGARSPIVLQPVSAGGVDPLQRNSAKPSRRLWGPSFGADLDGNDSHQPPRVVILFLAIAIMFLGLTLDNFWIGIAGSLVALILSLQILWTPLRRLLVELIPEQERGILFGSIFGTLALLGFLKLTGVFARIWLAFSQAGWDAVGSIAELLGAVGQILIAVLAVYIAWRQYIISRDLTIQQNTITQQQTIDAYFQGISELVLDEEGLLEDWPQERAIAEGRTAAIFSSVDAAGKSKIIRFLSRARLLTPLKRDRRLGRAILDGSGGYEEDRLHGIRVIDLGVMLALADLSKTDLRWTDLSEANLIRSNLSFCDLVKANFARTILCDAQLQGADLNGTRFFYGKAEDASPRSRTEPPDYRTGKHTGAVIEKADFTDVKELSDEQRYYICAWGGAATRGTVPGGCEGIPNKLGR